MNPPTKVTVKLTQRSIDALNRAAQAAELNRTDTINRAIQLYDFIVNEVDGHADRALIIERDGRQERIILR